MPHGRAFARLADLLKRSRQRPELRSKLSERRCLSAWPEAVGERIAAATRPVKMRDGTLTIAVKNSVWKNELGLMRSKIVEKLNAALGEPAVKRVRFSTGWEPQPADERESGSADSRDAGGELEALAPAEKAEIERAVSRIDDERISSSLFSAWATKRSLDRTRKTAGWNECPMCGALKGPEAGACPVCESRKG